MVLGIHCVAIQEDDRQCPRAYTPVQFQTKALQQQLSERLHCKFFCYLFPKEFHRTCKFRKVQECDYHGGMDHGRLLPDASRCQSFHPMLDKSMNHRNSRWEALKFNEKERILLITKKKSHMLVLLFKQKFLDKHVSLFAYYNNNYYKD